MVRAVREPVDGGPDPVGEKRKAVWYCKRSVGCVDHSDDMGKKEEQEERRAEQSTSLLGSCAVKSCFT